MSIFHIGAPPPVAGTSVSIFTPNIPVTKYLAEGKVAITKDHPVGDVKIYSIGTSGGPTRTGGTATSPTGVGVVNLVTLHVSSNVVFAAVTTRGAPARKEPKEVLKGINKSTVVTPLPPTTGPTSTIPLNQKPDEEKPQNRVRNEAAIS